MNVVINAVLSHKQPRGVGRYINNLLPAMADLDDKNHYYVYYGKWMANYEFLKIKQYNFHFIELNIVNNQILRNLYLATILPIKCKKFNPDIFFLIDTQALLFKPCKVVSTIHDLAEFVVPEKYSKGQSLIRRIIVKIQVKLSDIILTVSHYSKNDICKRFRVPDDKVHVIYNAVKLENNIKTLAKPEDYFLFVGEIEKAKNLMELIKAFEILPKKVQEKYSIYVVGKKGNDFHNIIKELEKKNLLLKVKFWGYVSDEELTQLYAKAFAFIFPSLFEGFGLPVLEAMAKGVPVLCSNTSSIPEVGGDAVMTFSPYDEKELANQINILVNDNELREKMIFKGMERAKLFTSSKSATDTLSIINDERK